MKERLTVCRDRPRHADLSVAEWEHLCGVRERHWPFSRAVERSEQEDEQRDNGKLSLWVCIPIDQEAHTSDEECPKP